MSASNDLRRFGDHTRTSVGETERVRRRVLASLDRIELHRAGRRAAVRWRLGTVALAATIVVGAVLVTSFESDRGTPERSDVSLVAELPSSLELTSEVRFEFQGAGSASGTRQEPRVDWRAGTIRADVEPGCGIDLQVRTPEGLVSVLGTVFEVDRGALGTRVSVERGRVRVDCDLGASAMLERGGRHTCLPVTAAGLLGRARALQASGAPLGEALTALELGLGRPGAPEAVRTELRFVRVEILVEAGQRKEALLEARRLHALGGHRADELGRLVERLSR